ncbi:MAG TPA: ATP-binding protein [Ramlibacter sp.]|uniref:ATP-binding protein n=1 Tax=Ramlibacter sp. TaxID=1917967 RepID=UPI002ED01AC9
MKRSSEGLWALGKYLALASSALTILLTVLMIMVIERTASEGVAASIGTGLAERAAQTANRLDRAMFERYREIQLMSSRLARLGSWEEVQAELDAAKETYRFYAWLGVADARGTVRAASGGLLKGQDVSQRPWFANAHSGIHLGDVHEAVLLAKLVPPGADGEPQRFFDVAFPLRGGTGPTGVLGAHVSWDWAKDVRQAIFGSSSEVEVLIVNTDGYVLLGPPQMEGGRLVLASLDRAGNARGHNVEMWPDGKRYLAGYAASKGYLSSPGLGWRVLVRQPLEVAYAPLRRIQAQVLAWGATLAVLFSLIGWLASRAVTRPLLELADTARRLEQGESVAVRPSHAYREVEVLGSALDGMVGKLREQSEALRELNAGLEQRVEQRTAELREAFERVRHSEQRTQTIIESALDPFVGIDLQGRVTDWSTRAEAVFGWAREEAIGRNAGELLVPERFADSFGAALEQYQRTGVSGSMEHGIERVLVDRSGREIPVELRIGLVNTGDERFLTAFIHDISHRKEVERMKDEFVSTVSHELRTPLTAIYGSLNLLTSGMAGELPEEAKQLLAISHESTDRLVRLINDMLDLEKIASGKIEYRMQPQPLRALVEQAIRDTQAYAEGLRVRIELQAGAEPRVHADADRIVQVCVNLLSNAAKFSPKGAVVQVTLQEHDGLARVGVADTGPGVPPEFRDRMFQRFAQADASDRRAKGGTGLGLAICRSIVEAHGGKLAFTSEPDVRTEFFFELPALAG